MKKTLSILLVSASLITGGCQTVETRHTSSYQPGVIPKATKPSNAQIQQTRSLLTQQAAKDKLTFVQSGATYNRTKRIVNRLSRAAGLGNFSYPVYIADAGNTANAFAYQGNTIVVYKALADRLPRDDEYAAVLSHEVAHILGSHHVNQDSQQRQVAVNVAASVLGSLIGGDAGQLASIATNTVGTGYFVRPYERGMEYEADHVGMLLQAKAGYNPEGAIRMWKKAGSVLGSAGSRENFLSTHPAHGNRVARLEQTLPAAKRYYHP